jgi:hypothetical protein
MAMRKLKALFNSIIYRKQNERNVELHIAIHHKGGGEVEKWLRAGADPNSYAQPGITPHRPLGEAVKCGASLEVIDALLKAGADPQEPYRFMGREFLNSEAAELSGLSKEIVARLKLAEKEAEAKNGPRELFRGYGGFCGFKPKFGT